MAGKPKYDWESLRKLYVSGEVDELTQLSRERTGDTSRPSLQTIKNTANKEGWTEQKKAFLRQVSTQVGTQLGTPSGAYEPTKEKIEQSVNELIDTAEMLGRQLRISKVLQSYAWDKLKNSSPDELTMKDALAFFQTAIDIERKAMGMLDINLAIETCLKYGYEVVDPTSGDLQQLINNN